MIDLRQLDYLARLVENNRVQELINNKHALSVFFIRLKKELTDLREENTRLKKEMAKHDL